MKSCGNAFARQIYHENLKDVRLSEKVRSSKAGERKILKGLDIRDDSSPSVSRMEPNFVECISDYIKNMAQCDKLRSHGRQTKATEKIKPSKSPLAPSRNETMGKRNNMKSLKKELEKEKQVNRHLQKCVIQIQRVLWQRGQTLHLLDKEFNAMRNSQCDPRKGRSEIEKDKKKGKDKGDFKTEERDLLDEERLVNEMDNERFQNLWGKPQWCPPINDRNSSSTISLSRQSEQNINSSVKQVLREHNDHVRNRRRTEVPQQLQHILTKTVTVKSKSRKK